MRLGSARTASLGLAVVLASIFVLRHSLLAGLGKGALSWGGFVVQELTITSVGSDSFEISRLAADRSTCTHQLSLEFSEVLVSKVHGSTYPNLHLRRGALEMVPSTHELCSKSELSPKQPSNTPLMLPVGSVEIDSFTLSGTLPFGADSIEIQNLSLSRENGVSDGGGERLISARLMLPPIKGVSVVTTPFEIAGTLKLGPPQEVAFHGTVTVGGSQTLKVLVDGTYSSLAGHGDLALALPKGDVTERIGDLEKLSGVKVPSNISVQSGTLSAATHLTLNPSFRGELSVDLKSVDASLSGIQLKGLDASLQIPLARDRLPTSHSKISVRAISAPVEIANLLLVGDLVLADRAQWSFLSGSLRGFGGVVSASASSPLAKSGEQALDFSFDHLQIADILAIYPSAAIVATGEVSGKGSVGLRSLIPVAGGVSFNSLEGADLKLAIPLGEEQQTAFIAAALSNIQVKELDGFGVFSEDGILRTTLHISGRNPTLSSNRPIELSLAVEENLRALFRSVGLLMGREAFTTKPLK